MNIIIGIIVGGIAGWLAGQIMGSKFSVLGNIIIGVVGGFVGSTVLRFVGIYSYGWNSPPGSIYFLGIIVHNSCSIAQTTFTV